jgi:hypothetical protein
MCQFFFVYFCSAAAKFNPNGLFTSLFRNQMGIFCLLIQVLENQYFCLNWIFSDTQVYFLM